mmetsp:Transcript_11832/g.18164  ORF Transcript_11832/g.18164 Transcript_11832/m.18164 type:complete len:309 (-) Transcript_11832:128-1054(-)|eukprot:CAMPEP_0178927838 /NCGR_PEP_ID=MMETSP0786-20121207/19470_1 /TAXON_ID=186022 /ORGANISM="Thalassionema frauenfeldii, Strain CCMP 1798" /LENGTH=308 /DNA_ID=CAMNT_0020603435 /DNA_START=55 /DNA_END=981 /DNA_ORIENTATION=+
MISTDDASSRETKNPLENKDESVDTDAPTQNKRFRNNCLSESKDDGENLTSTEAEGNQVNRWKAVVGSASWRNFMRSRRLLLRGGINGQTLLDNSHDKQHSRRMLLGQTLNKLSPGLPQRHLALQEERDISGEDEELMGGFGANLEPLIDEEITGKPSHNKLGSKMLVSEIESLEYVLDEQEDEIYDLEEKLAETKNNNISLTENLHRKGRSFRSLEERYTELKCDLAKAHANEDEIRSEMNDMVMIRDLDAINLKNEFNQLKARMKHLEKVNLNASKQLEKAKIVLKRKKTRLSEALIELAELKGEH